MGVAGGSTPLAFCVTGGLILCVNVYRWMTNSFQSFKRKKTQMKKSNENIDQPVACTAKSALFKIVTCYAIRNGCAVAPLI
jgi:hypothetical protein